MMLTIGILLLGALTLAFGATIAYEGLVKSDPVGYVIGLLIVIMSATGIVAVLVRGGTEPPLECETLVETMVTVGDVEVCVPTPDAIDFLEVYQGVD